MGGQSREHLLLAFTFGIKEIVVVVNKMDEVKFSQVRFEEIKQEVSAVMKRIGYKPMKTHFVPVSAWDGDNILTGAVPDRMPWYNGPTFVEALDALSEVERATDKPLRIPLQDVYQIGGVGLVGLGKIESGVLREGMDVTVAPGRGKTATVNSIEMHFTQMQEASAGDSVGFNLSGIAQKDLKVVK